MVDASSALAYCMPCCATEPPRHLADVAISAIKPSVSDTLRSKQWPLKETYTSVAPEPSRDIFASTPAPIPPVFSFSYCASSL